MRFTPLSDELVPEGDYWATVFMAKDETSKAGNAMIKVSLGVHVGDDGIPHAITDYVLEKVAYKLRHFCEAVGEDYNSGDINCRRVTDAQPRVMVRVAIETDKQTGKPKNAIKDYLPGAAGTAAQTQPVDGGSETRTSIGERLDELRDAAVSSSGATDDDIPFAWLLPLLLPATLLGGFVA